MKKRASWKILTRTGEKIMSGWKELASRHQVALEVSGIPAIPSFSFSGEKSLAYKTLLTQEMLEMGYLASGTVFVSVAHTGEIIDGYFGALNKVFQLIRDCEEGRDVKSLLKGPVCHGGFKRLN
jgi:glutamate-1-semialdehyde 2,1-aminomutase